jgi:hypothetical protein
MINSVKTIDCSTCYSRGYIFFGDNDDCAIEPCDCVLNDELNVDWIN